MGAQLNLEFITDQRFRASLEADFEEMQQCAKSQSWKAVHVLAGSIIEAILVDYLVSTNQKKPDPLRMTLGGLIDACREAGILTERTADLSSALKSYRNLIHPGRAVRLGESADEEGALVAQALVSIIVKEVGAKQEQVHGYTAEQIVTKFESDPSALGIAQHLLKEARPGEIERVLLHVLPSRYFDEAESEWPDRDVMEAHARLFRAAFEDASDATKRRVMAKYVSVLKEEPGERVQAYEEEFFRAPDLAYLKRDDRALVKAHLFARLREQVTKELIEVTRGIGGFLVPEDVSAFVDPLARAAVASREASLTAAARDLLTGEAANTPTKLDPTIVKRLQGWVDAYARRDLDEQAGVLEEIRLAYEIPF